MTNQFGFLTPGEADMAVTRNVLLPLSLLTPSRQHFRVDTEYKFHLSNQQTMSPNAKNSEGDMSCPETPDSSLPEGEYFVVAADAIREIIARYGRGTASKGEIQAAIVSYIGDLAAAEVYDFDVHKELIPWLETLDAEVTRLDGAAKRGAEGKGSGSGGGGGGGGDDGDDNGVTVDNDGDNNAGGGNAGKRGGVAPPSGIWVLSLGLLWLTRGNLVNLELESLRFSQINSGHSLHLPAFPS
ncbi:hypothetical protein BDZ89DRAFT_1245231 [Hymenopellis radicata]|nr:hypothetical protein BDZ89DRAFT_1245231 [Hymenopellis radicata]